ncbi:MAG: GatB/YqeY domain-containing protein [Patescibacteria group bacterium]
MSLKEKILNDLKKSLKSRDALKRDTLRLISSAIKNAEIEKMKKEEGLNDQEVLEVLKKAVKQRNDSIEQYEKGGRSDLAEKEKKELEIISVYLPEQMNEEKVREEIKAVIFKTGATSMKDFGKVMGVAMKKLQGQADGSVVKEILEEELNK